METITLPSGATVTLRDASEFRQKDREKIWSFLDDSDNQIIKANAMIKGIIAFMVKEWSFDFIIPSVMISSLGELNLEDYDALANKAGDLQKVIFPNFMTGEDNPDSPLAN